MLVIIGAGPAGLYAAIKFWQAGIRDIVVFDPRAGIYTRSGFLEEKIFNLAERGIGSRFPITSQTHIKNLERYLYDKAIALGIKIEQKEFIRLYQSSSKSGVVVAEKKKDSNLVPDENESEEVVLADFVFDCTGSYRAVIHEVNRLISGSPFKLSSFCDMPAPHHFMAYVKVNEPYFSQQKYARYRLYIISSDCSKPCQRHIAG